MLMFAVVPALAQTPITSQTSVPLSFNVPSSVSINCTTPTFTVAGLTATSSTITCTENWDLPAGLGYGQGICVAQYFNTATPFGASGPDSSAVSAAVNGGSAVAFPSASGLIPSGGSSLPCSNTLGALLSAQYYGPLLNHGATEPIQGSNTDTDVITVNLTGLGATTYSGNLNFAMGAM
jgi:hypothetical protein